MRHSEVMVPPPGSKRFRLGEIMRALGREEPAAAEVQVVAPALIAIPTATTSDLDGLTGLPNEVGFKALLLHEIRVAQRRIRYPGEQLFVVYLDLNGVKQINDTLGHDAGDVMLKGAGDAPRYGILRPGEVFARLHGDEYAGLLYARNYDAVLERGEVLRDAMFEGVRFRLDESSELFGIAARHPAKSHAVLQAARRHFSVAIGFAAMARPTRNVTAETLMADAIARADKEMYRQKQVHHLINADDAWREAVRNFHAFDTSFESITDWLDSRDSGLSLDTRTELTILLKKRDDLRWKVGIDAVEAKEKWLVDVVPALSRPGFRTSPALYIDAAIVTELRTRLGIRHSDQRLPEFSARPNAGQVERLQNAMDAMAGFDYARAPHGITGYGRPSALIPKIPRSPTPLARAVATAETPLAT